MTKAEELNLFLARADEFIEGKYILADIKIVGLLKSIAYSKTLLAMFENCLKDFDYVAAKKKYLVKNKFLSEDKGEFILPSNSRELLAFTFAILMDIDSHKINLNEFINKYFYVDGSFSSGYTKFLNDMIKPFRASVKKLMESVISGAVQDPIEALTEREEENARLQAQLEKEQKQKEALSKKAYAESIEKIRKILLEDKTHINAKVKDEQGKAEFILIIDMLANALYSEDRDAISYAHLAYKFMAKAHPFKFLGRNRKISKLILEVYNGL